MNAGVAIDVDPTFALIKQRRFSGYVGEPEVEYKSTLLVVVDIVTIFVGLNIGAINNTEIVRAQPDHLIDTNAGLVPFLDLFVDGHNSNLASNAYGFLIPRDGFFAIKYIAASAI